MFRDRKGREIQPGDLLRSYHFRDYRRRHNYLYHVVVVRNGVLWMVPTCHMHKAEGGGDCRLTDDQARRAEVIFGHGGEHGWWRDRPTHKAHFAEIDADAG